MRKFTKKKSNYKNYYLKNQKKQKNCIIQKKYVSLHPLLNSEATLIRSFIIIIINTFINY